MDLQEEHTKEEESNKEEEDESERPKSKSIYEVEIMEGKREKKTVQRLDMQVPKPKEKLRIESIGKGDKLGDIPRVNHAIGRLKAPLLKPLHKIIYDRPGAVASLRKHLRLFNGFPFEVESDPYNKKRIKMLKIPKVQLKSICQILDIERSGSQAVLADRIMQFLVNPTNSGKPVILKKKRKKKTAKDTKREKKTTSKSKKQQIDPGKSKEIVTSSSDEEDDDDEDEGDRKNRDTEKSSVSDSRKQKGDDSDSEEESVESDDGLGDSEDEKKTNSKKSSNKKKPTPKITEDNSDLSASDEDEDDESAEEVTPKKTKKKPIAPKKKPAPKTKKADSSSNRKRKDAGKSKAKVESSDEDDQPLIKLIKKPPTNEQLQDKIKDLLKTVNLEEVTMKQICQQVYDLYPDFNLTDRKDVIKDTVKSLIS